MPVKNLSRVADGLFMVKWQSQEEDSTFQTLLDQAQDWDGGFDLEYYVSPVEEHAEALIAAHYPSAEVELALKNVADYLVWLAEDQEADRLRLMVETLAVEQKTRILQIARNPTIFTPLSDVLNTDA